MAETKVAICPDCKENRHTNPPDGRYACGCDVRTCACFGARLNLRVRTPQLSVMMNRHGNVVIYFGNELVDRVNVRNMDDLEEKIRTVKSAISGAGFSYSEDVDRYVREKLS